MNSQPKGTRLSRIGIWTAIIGVVLVAISSGHKLGLLATWQMAFAALGLGGLLLAIAFVTAGLGLWRSGGTGGGASRPATWLAFIAGLIVTAINVNGMRSMGGPPIHDISTDTADPPQFVDVVALRKAAGATNPPGYSAEESAAKQAEAYPDIRTVVVQAPAAQVFEQARTAAEDMGWEIVAAMPAEGRIEATATTAWIGFKDDVVIRIREAGGETRVDVRSKSRVGRGDVGMNARRIRAFMSRLFAT
jgi:hypothetical protein